MINVYCFEISIIFPSLTLFDRYYTGVLHSIHQKIIGVCCLILPDLVARNRLHLVSKLRRFKVVLVILLTTIRSWNSIYITFVFQNIPSIAFYSKIKCREVRYRIMEMSPAGNRIGRIVLLQTTEDTLSVAAASAFWRFTPALLKHAQDYVRD